MIGQFHIASDSLQILTRSYVENSWLQAVTGLLLLAMFAWAANWVAKRIVLTLLLRLVDHLPFRVDAAHIGAVVARLSNIVPALIIQSGIAAVPHLSVKLAGFIASLHGVGGQGRPD